MIGGKGLKGNSWPDLDMLPFGWLTDPGNETGLLLFHLLIMNVITLILCMSCLLLICMY